MAITHFDILDIQYTSLSEKKASNRRIAPLGVYMTRENWVLIAWCYLRKAHRAFRIDQITRMQTTNEKHAIGDFNLQDYFEACRKKVYHP